MDRIVLVCFIAVVLIAFVPAAMADDIAITGSNVVYKVNVGDIYTSRSPLTQSKPTGQTASSGFSDGVFQFSVNAPAGVWTDAGIIMGFDGTLTLGALQSLTIGSTDSPLSLTLWLDTDNDGRFLNFVIGLNSDHFGNDARLGINVLPGSGLGLTTPLTLYSLNGSSPSSPTTYTLADLQSGALGGINANTHVAVWLGISSNDGQSHTAHVGNITLDPVGPNHPICEVPEPGVLLLLALGIGTVGLLPWRMKR